MIIELIVGVMDFRVLLFLSFACLFTIDHPTFSSDKTFNPLRDTICKKSSTTHGNGVEEELWALGFKDERQRFILPDGLIRTYDVEVVVEKPFVLKIDFQAMNEKKEQNRQEVFSRYSERIKQSLTAGKIRNQYRKLRK